MTMMEGFSEMMTCKMIQYFLFQTFLYIHVLKKLSGIWVFGLKLCPVCTSPMKRSHWDFGEFTVN